MRSALKMPGITGIEIKAGNPDFKVSYDASKVKVDEMLTALEKAGEPAKKKS